MSEQRYLVAARKYRPQRFDEVVAQEHVCETLSNAISRGRLGHAYLFSGPRGVGKTTVARILAKSINCTTPMEERDGAEPCQKCDSCKSFSEGRNLNVIEIDAASNNKVDDVRELRDTVRIPPQGAIKKVYIVDEVHMLTSQAFNALLKTLEEPPPYVLFIFATTEPHKVLPTILSRCQRFDFRRIAVPEIVERLKEICTREKIEADEASLLLIAQKGDGALRDSLSVFDQAVALCGSTVTYDALARALGVVDIELYFETTRFIRDGNAAGVLNLVSRVVSSGFDMREFLAGLAHHLRNLMVAVTTSDTSLIETTQPIRDRYNAEAAEFSESRLLRLMSIAADTEYALRSSPNLRLQLELGLLKMVKLADAVDLRTAMERLDVLIGSVGETTSAEPSGGYGQPPAQSVTPDSTLMETGATQKIEKQREAGKKSEEKGPPQPSVKRAPAPLEPASAGTAGNPAEPADDRTKESTAAPDLFGPPALSRRQKTSGAPSGGTIEGSTARASAELTHSDPEATAQTSVLSQWLPFVKQVKSDRIHVGSLLQHAAPANLAKNLLEIDVPDDFHRRLLENQHDFLLSHARAVIYSDLVGLRFNVRASVTAPSGETGGDFDPYEYMQRKRKDNPVIKAIFDEFGGELVW